MTKKTYVLAFLFIFLFGFIIGYVTMTFDIAEKDKTRNFLQILSPF